jgi:hypothetical protein
MTQLKLTIAVVFLVCSGCTPKGPSAVEITFSEFKTMGRCFASLSFEECEAVLTLPDRLAIASRNGCISMTEETRDRFQSDSWEQPYRFTHTIHEDRIVIQILSLGNNGKFDNGVGDDLVCDVTLPKNGNGTYVLTYDGRRTPGGAHQELP